MKYIITILLCLLSTCGYAANSAAHAAQPTTYETLALSLFGFVLIAFLVLAGCMIIGELRDYKR